LTGSRSRFPLLLAATVAGGTILGLQLLRALFPLLVYVARDRFGLSSVALGGLGALLFSTAFGLPALVARGSAVRALARAAIVLVLLRAALQIWTGDPIVSLVVAAAAVVAFQAFLVAVARLGATHAVAVAVLLGAALDASVHALAGTRDLHWGGVVPTVVTLGLAALIGAAAWRLRRASPSTDSGSSSGIAAPALFVWGPWLLLQLELFGNVARLSSRTGDSTSISGAWIAAGLGLAVLVSARAPRSRALAGAGLPLLAAALLFPSILRSETIGRLAPVIMVVAQIAGALLLARALESRLRPAGDLAPGLAFGAGLLAFLILVFGHYAGYDLPLPGSARVWAGAGAALLVGAAARARPGEAAAPGLSTRAVAGIAILGAILPLLRGAPPRPLAAAPGESIRAITFNLHNGFDEQGRFALDGMLDRLAREEPDVLALQEVSRGWVVNGSTDLYELARARLGLHGVYGPSVSTDWGNAVFSRFAPDSVRRIPLPPRDLPLPRQATVVDLPAGPAGVAVRVIATHLHHVEEGDAVRSEQARSLAALGAPRGAILLGDFNALPSSEPLAVLGAAGWQDAGAVDPGPFSPTYPSRAPTRRIDTVLAGAGTRILASRVAAPWKSDHRAVVVDLEP
jgi:endonuclease/exonuclease/phosphatase family metal-dependent hydrolase